MVLVLLALSRFCTFFVDISILELWLCIGVLDMALIENKNIRNRICSHYFGVFLVDFQTKFTTKNIFQVSNGDSSNVKFSKLEVLQLWNAFFVTSLHNTNKCCHVLYNTIVKNNIENMKFSKKKKKIILLLPLYCSGYSGFS